MTRPTPHAATGLGAVAMSFGLSMRATGLVLRGLGRAIRLLWRAAMAWALLMAGRPGEDEVMVLRRRKWIALTFLALPVAGATLVAPVPMLRTVGAVPMLASLVLVAGAGWRARRLTRRARRQPTAAVPGPAPAVWWGDYHPTARSTELEQTLGNTLWHLAAAGVSVDTALYAARAMPQRSQLWLLTVAEANLAALGRLEDQHGQGVTFGATDAAVWLFPFCEGLRAWIGLRPNVPTEPALNHPTQP